MEKIFAQEIVIPSDVKPPVGVISQKSSKSAMKPNSCMGSIYLLIIS